MTLDSALPLLVCPESKQPLSLRTNGFAQELVCPATNKHYPVRDGIPVFAELAGDEAASATFASFETKYQTEAEPWSYSGRAAELMRHEFVVDIARRFNPCPERVLDLGCSNGQLSYRLGEAFLPPSSHICSLDISPTAVAQAREYVQSSKADYFFLAASSTEIPFADNTFDTVIVSDGLHGWELPPDLQRRVVAEVSRVLRAGGYAVFTDYLHPKKFDGLIELIGEGAMTITTVEYLYDRLWYRIESWFHLVQRNPLVKAFLRNMAFARALKSISRLSGRNGSKHICVVTQKPQQ